jgi:predicted transcriptional regulator
MPLKRITITIPDPLLTAADERSRTLERSRSWVLVDALRRYLAEETGEQTPAVAEGAPASYGDRRAAGLGPYRLAQLESDLGLPVLDRVRESELAARVTELRTTPTRSQRVLTFDRYEDFLEWERWEERAR